MVKQSELDQIYQAAFNDEFEKVAKTRLAKEVTKRSIKAFDKSKSKKILGKYVPSGKEMYGKDQINTTILEGTIQKRFARMNPKAALREADKSSPAREIGKIFNKRNRKKVKGFLKTHKLGKTGWEGK